MTVLVGILCSDGVVVATDSAATFGVSATHPTIGQLPVQKLHCLHDRILFCATGAVGMGQIICAELHEMYSTNVFRNRPTPEAAMDLIGRKIHEKVVPYIQSQAAANSIGQALCKSLVAMPIGHNAFLFQFDFGGAPERATKDLPFVALGSGQPIADPFLAFLKRLLWSEREPTVSEGRFAAVWTIDHVRRTNPGGVGGDIQLATLTRGGNASLAPKEDVDEHLQRVAQAEGALVGYINGSADGEPVTLPAAPAP